jgi:hypothetical protein
MRMEMGTDMRVDLPGQPRRVSLPMNRSRGARTAEVAHRDKP